MLSCVQLFATLWTVTHQASLSMGFSRQKYWSVLPFPPPEDLPDSGIKTISPMSPALHWQVDSLPLRHLGSPNVYVYIYICVCVCVCVCVTWSYYSNPVLLKKVSFIFLPFKVSFIHIHIYSYSRIQWSFLVPLTEYCGKVLTFNSGTLFLELKTDSPQSIQRY